ncbi:PLAC8 family [Olea europaea subsp. europaea]|uniref:PLAC8 family n=1 Tax=Olea europaea subsp. europaea TaxID=158383 RepID=A0A8S0SMM1_OLEEU|nr:PLAC8 family [Olea europaea subsp. europaea]
MPNQKYMDKLQLRQNYHNLWHSDLMRTMQNDPLYCCLAIWCGPCVSYRLRKRAIHNDMSRYVCCAGYMSCSGRCGESRCPKFCLATETQHKIEMDKRDGKFGPQPMTVPPAQQMSRLDQPYAPTAGYPTPS